MKILSMTYVNFRGETVKIDNLERIISSIENKHPTSKDYIKVIAFLNKYYKKGQIVYLDAVQRNCKLDKDNAIKALELCKNAGLVSRRYVAKCPICNHLDSITYNSANDDIPESTNCIHCDTEINILDSFEVVYMINKIKSS